ncbi:hypothetical protein SAMN05444004_101176 [Jannaschia faecimaris]|uniref:Uncharacterized protein n=1 Tax=Jannaschia faecimaris TaxID=1244108 RepID=A0A1H3J1S2_9RHOB|nr:hypothetical protein [Jannaschia faecimaris]SDY33757.1 hypothetical protein SAMN05444004_101176 [Jannaschia faecimaris]
MTRFASTAIVAIMLLAFPAHAGGWGFVLPALTFTATVDPVPTPPSPVTASTRQAGN